MADVLGRHVSEVARSLRKRLLTAEPPSDLESGARLTPADIHRAVSDTLPRGATDSLNTHRAALVERVADLLWASTQKDRRRPAFDMFGIRDELRTRTAKPWCDQLWKHLDFREEYLGLLRTAPKSMSRLARGALPAETAEGMARSAQQVDVLGSFDDSDVGALAHLDHLLNGAIRPRYRHVVVDEAQDLSPIEFLCLAASSTNNWFTVLGDTAQRLTSHRGVGRWRDLDRVFGRSDIAVQRARRSYRSTIHITRFNNRILRTFDENLPAPIPFERQGHRVEYHRYERRDEMYGGVVEDLGRIRGLAGMDGATIAVLARDRANLNGLADQCLQAGVIGAGFIRPEGLDNSSTLLGRIHDVKGLEFDAVIVMGVNESFSDAEFNRKLLYLATTRAKHYLALHWAGRRSPILKAVSDSGIVWGRA